MGEALLMNRSQEWNPEYTFTGDSTFTDEGNGNWNIKFTSSGTLMFIQPNSARRGIDVFLVGGGGGASASSGPVYSAWNHYGAWAGGGGGYTTTVMNIAISRRIAYPIVVGAGGTGVKGGNPNSLTTYRAEDGGASSAFDATAAGGKGAYTQGRNTYEGQSEIHRSYPGSGGSGGAGIAGNYFSAIPSTGGMDGSDGNQTTGKGIGQHSTTREFGLSDGFRYSDGGSRSTVDVANRPNTGEGGGFAQVPSGWDGGNLYPCYHGSSGIVIIRNHRE